MTDLIYARILSPSSKLSSYDYCHSLLEPPKYSLQNLHRALSVMAEESGFIQEELYRNSNFAHPRNTRILYYDCTNYYFEIEQDNDFRKYGKSKEQTTLKPLESTIIHDFGCSEFIFCSDAGLGSKSNRFFNSFGNRSYVITQSLKKMKKEDRDIALNPTQYRALGSSKMIDLRSLDETDENFLSCYISLLVYRLLEKKLSGNYTCEQLLNTLRSMRLTMLPQNAGYVPSYKRTDITDELHKTFGFHTDYEFISKSSMRSIIKGTKTKKE